MKKTKKKQGLEAEAREIKTENRFLSVELISLWNMFPKRGGKALILPMSSEGAEHRCGVNHIQLAGLSGDTG